ncbi:MAG TPA: alpha/beta fold hydrolase [Thermomicrobiaceae bacterium]|nr:alpha/beta fold hydrolase [Thermomicrobiaceae bacterium]
MSANNEAIERHDLRVTAVDGVGVAVREVRRVRPDPAAVPVVLVHGARVPGIGSFDLPVPGGSLAADLARAGHAAYLLDARGYGGSDRPEAMSRPSDAGPPLVRAPEVVRDLAAVVGLARERSGRSRVALLGWATGGMWAGLYATLWPETLSHLVLYNALYRSPVHPSLGAGSDLEDPGRPGTFNAAGVGAYRLNAAASLTAGWDRAIPLEDRATWRDPEVVSAYVAAALASDPTSAERTPPSFRSPSGALEDSFYQALGRQIWDASLVRTPTLVLASERDFWSQPADREALREHLTHAHSVRVVVVPDATHWVHLDRPERGRARFLAEVLAFLGDEPPALYATS